MKRFLLLQLLMLLSLSVSAQKWHTMILEGETDYKKIQREFYKEWDGKQVMRGRGYKQFKRWEHFYSTRLDRKGKIINVANNYFLKKKLRAAGAQQRSANAEHTWTSLGPKSWENTGSGYNPGVGRINCVTVDPSNPDVVYVGAPVGGIWKSTDNGLTWELLTEDFTNVGVSDIYVDPDDSNSLLITTGDCDGGDTNSIGIMKSSDGGETWEETGLVHENNSGIRYYKMEIMPSNKNEILLAGNTGVLRSEDSGDTWTTVISNGSFSDLMIHPTNEDIVYATKFMGGGSTYEIHKSTDGGETWEMNSFAFSEVSNGFVRTALAVSPAAPDYVYVMASGSDGGFGAVLKSTDAAENFEVMATTPNVMGYAKDGSDSGGQGSYDLAIAANPENAEQIFVAGINVWKSEDGGESFENLAGWSYEGEGTPYTHADTHTLDIYNGTLYCGSDGGIFRSSDSGTTWLDISSGLDIAQVYRLGSDPNDEGVIVMGAQDNGSNILRDGQWYHIFGADGMEALVDHTNGNIVYSTYQNGGLNKYDDRGDTYLGTIAGGSVTGSGLWVTPYTLDPNDSEIIYAGYSQLFKSMDGGSNWTAISAFASSSRISHLKVARADPNYIYVLRSGRIFKTENGGRNWLEITAGLPNQSVSSIGVSENNPLRLWVTISGSRDGEKIYQSVDGGENWRNISEGLPNVVTNCVVHQLDSKDQLYLGTDIGVYQRDLEMNQWELFSDGLPGVIVNELEIHYASNKIRAATYGRGIWETQIIENIADPMSLVDVTINREELTSDGLVVYFDAETEGSVDGYYWEFEWGAPRVSTETQGYTTFPAEGTFDVSLTISGPSGTESITKEDLVTYKVTNIDQNEKLFQVYPNPVIDVLSITFGTPMERFDYQLINSEGKVVLNEQVNKKSDGLKLDIRDIESGIYFLKINSEAEQLTRKILVTDK